MNPFRYVRYLYRQLRGLLVFRRRVGILGHFTVGNPRNIHIGRDCGINHGVFILGHERIEIGNGVVLSAGAMLIDAGLHPADFSTDVLPRHVSAPITIGDGAWIGAGAIILAGVTVGERAIVGAGSVVTKDVSAGSVVAGVPARAIRVSTSHQVPTR